MPEPAAPNARLVDFAVSRFTNAIRPAEGRDLDEMARIHVTSGTPGLLTDLGERFLRDVFYAGVLSSPVGGASVVEVKGSVVGFVTYSPDSRVLFREIFRRRLFATARAVLRAAMRKPRVLLDFVETALRSDDSGGSGVIRAESVSLEVAPAYQGLGLGFVLLQTAVSQLRAAGAGSIKARILECNREVERLYPPLGFARGPRFRLHGRDWVLMVLAEPSEVPKQ